MKRYGPGWGGIEPEDDGDYVEYDEATARIAALEALLHAAHDHMHELTAIIPANDAAYELTTRLMASIRAALQRNGET